MYFILNEFFQFFNIFPLNHKINSLFLFNFFKRNSKIQRSASLRFLPSLQINNAKKKQLGSHRYGRGPIKQKDRTHSTGNLDQMGRSKNQKIKWIDCWQFNFNNVRFLIQAAYNVLPSLLNLHLRKS